MKETYIAEYEEGPTTGLLVDLEDGSQIWSGGVSEDLFAQQDPEVQAQMGTSFGFFVVVASRNDPLIVCRASTAEDGIDIVRALALLNTRAIAAKSSPCPSLQDSEV